MRIGLLATALITVTIGGVGTIAISRNVALRQTQAFLLRSAHTLSLLVGHVHLRLLHAVVVTSQLTGVRLLSVNAKGALIGKLPHKISAHVISIADLRHNQPQLGATHGVAFVAYPILRASGLNVLVLTHPLPSIVQPAIFVVLAAILTAMIAVVVADWYTGRITRSLDDLVTTANRVAGGDLSTDTPTPPPSELEIAELQRAIDQMVTSLRTASEHESQFLLAISHDLRTPLTSIKGFAEAIIDQAIDDPTDAALIIAREASRIEHLISDLISLARLRSSDFAIHPQQVSLGDILAHLSDTMALRANQAKIALDVTLPSADILLTIDPERLVQLVTNLVENAIKYASHEVTLQVTHHPQAIVIEVRDDGPGIPAHRRPLLFSRQVPPTPGRDGSVGSGLGLLIVAQLAENMRLDLGIRSPLRNEGGTAVYVRIPIEFADPISDHPRFSRPNAHDGPIV
ncbi:MAG: sensor histidine kinase [Ferrimicrobium sp.]